MVLSPYILAVIAAWVAAQGTKYVIALFTSRNFDSLRQLYLSGNMPSAHAASALALLSVIGLKDGPESAVFGLAMLFAAIVMYDAIMVRRSVGEQGAAIQTLIRQSNKKVRMPRAAKGHSPLEVLVGAVLGVVIGWVVFFATN